MEITAISPHFTMPTKGTENSGAFDIYMPEPGIANGVTKFIDLGFAAAVPTGHVALLLPRSSSAKTGMELSNTCGVIDSDYRGEWKAAIKTKSGLEVSWQANVEMLVL
jgi:dUTP pyrophosphatase